MKQFRLRKAIIPMIGLFMGKIAIFGCYPFGLAYFTAVYAEQTYRTFIFSFVLLGMAFSLPVLSVVKYGMSMVIAMFAVRIYEVIQKKKSSWFAAGAAGCSICLMGAVEWGVLRNGREALIMAVLEGVFVFAGTLLFQAALSSMMEEQKKSCWEDQMEVAKKDKLNHFAETFQSLATTFGEMPKQKEKFNENDLEEIFSDISESVCSTCENCSQCWQKNYFDTYQSAYHILDMVEKNGTVLYEDVPRTFLEKCTRSKAFLQKSVQSFEKAKQKLLWQNRLLENREAVAGQFSAVAEIIWDFSKDFYQEETKEEQIAKEIKEYFSRHGIFVSGLSILKTKLGRKEIYIKMSSPKGACISAKSIGEELSRFFGKKMVPAKDSKVMVNKEASMFLFEEAENFKALCGVSRRTKEGEGVSGDNFAFTYTKDHRLVISLSDGMGSGIRAAQESEKVIELIEKFLEAGFCIERTVRMINSAMVIQTDSSMFSTIDICSLDLYSGMCECLKIGASAAFIRRDNWVEVIQSTSLPAGVFQELDIDATEKKLYDGDYVIMVTDGILDQIPGNDKEIVMQEILLGIKKQNPNDIAEELMKEILTYSDGVKDDMTVLVCGLWKNG